MMLRTNSARMFGALSATNEAILRAKSEDELFQRVCDAAVFGGKFLGTGMLLADGSGRLRCVAGAGLGVDTLKNADNASSVHADRTMARGWLRPHFAPAARSSPTITPTTNGPSAGMSKRVRSEPGRPLPCRSSGTESRSACCCFIWNNPML